MKKIFVLLLLIFSFAQLSAQTTLRGGAISKSKHESPTTIKESVKPLNSYVPDTLYCTKTVKRHGWMEPVDTLSADCLGHTNIIRFTKRNKAGNWTRVENFDAYGNYITGFMGPYIIRNNDYDTLVNKEWKEKSKQSCIIEFIGDFSGKNCVNERCYDKDMNIIYSYSRIPIGNNRFVGSYRDQYGLPVEMRMDKSFSFGTLVLIAEDDNGCESSIQFIDSKGNVKPNADGAFKEEYKYDKKGRTIYQRSLDADEKLIRDNAGNCGVLYEWNDKNQKTSSTYMDENWRPMPFPGISEDGYMHRGVVQVRNKYDKYCRLIEEKFYDSVGTKCTNEMGIHKVVYSYDEKGNCIEVKYLNLSDTPVTNLYGAAIINHEYDSIGHTIESRFLDADGNPNSNYRYLCRIINEYDSLGNLILEEKYAFVNKKEVLCYQYQIGKNFHKTLYSDGSFIIDSIDDKNRLVYQAIFDSNGERDTFNDGYSYMTVKYVDLPKSTIETTSYYDKDSMFVNPKSYSFASMSSVIDSTNYSIKRRLFDQNMNLFSCYSRITDSSFAFPLSEQDNSFLGNICRAGNEGCGEVFFYNCDVAYTPKGQFATLIGRDEFGEPDYIINKKGDILYYIRFIANSQDLYDEQNLYDVNNNIIDNDFKDTVPKVISVEVTDINCKLKDNDVILIYGDYSVDLSKSADTYADFMSKWTLHSALDADKSKRMVVFRVNPDTKEYGLVEISDLKGTQSSLGFVGHVRYLTDKQKDRIYQAIIDNSKSDNPIVSADDFTKSKLFGGNNDVIVTSSLYFGVDKRQPFTQTIKNPAVILGASMYETKESWIVGQDTEAFYSMLKNKENHNYQLTYYCICDNDSIVPYTSNSIETDVEFHKVTVSDETVSLLSKLISQTEYLINNDLDLIQIYNPNKFVGQWQYINNELNLLGKFVMDKSGEGSCTLLFSYDTNEEKEQEQEKESVTLGIKVHSKGKWQCIGHSLIFTFEAPEISASILDRKKADDSYVNRIEQNLNLFSNKLYDAAVEFFKVGSNFRLKISEFDGKKLLLTDNDIAMQLTKSRK